MDQAIVGDPNVESLSALNARVAALETHLAASRTAARPFLWLASRLGWLPSVGPSVRALPSLLNVGTEMAGAGHQALDAPDPVLALASEAGQGDLVAQAVPALSSATPELAAAEARLARAEKERTFIAGPARLDAILERLDHPAVKAPGCNRTGNTG
jgi:hypothetical protein